LIIGGTILLRQGIIVIGTYLATENPDAATVSIGSFREYYDKAVSNGYTAFDLGKSYELLNTIGLAKPMNSLFMSNQISQIKDFVGTSIENLTPGFSTEVSTIEGSGMYQQIGSGWTNIANLWSSTVNWWSE
jgi:hypothetical protein